MTNRLRELRVERGLSLREFANQMNCSYSNIATIERGEGSLTESNIKTFSEFFGVTTDYLLGVSNVRQPIDLNSKLSELDIKILTTVDDMSEAQKRDILKVMEIIKRNGGNNQ